MGRILGCYEYIHVSWALEDFLQVIDTQYYALFTWLSTPVNLSKFC